MIGKLTRVALAAGTSLALVLSGCGQSSSPSKQAAPAKPEAVKTAPGPSSAPGGSATGSASAQPAPVPQPAQKKYASLPPMKIDANKKYSALVKTNLGDFTIELLAKDAPQTVNSFVFLARDGYYNYVRFHRVIKEFMIQTGDPTATGMGGPGYNVPDELPVKLKYDPGIVAMARTPAPDSGGSQFFVCSGPQCAGLNNAPNYVQFGRVVQGMDVVAKIASVRVGPAGNEVSKPLEDVYMISVTIQEG